MLHDEIKEDVKENKKEMNPHFEIFDDVHDEVYADQRAHLHRKTTTDLFNAKHGLGQLMVARQLAKASKKALSEQAVALEEIRKHHVWTGMKAAMQQEVQSRESSPDRFAEGSESKEDQFQ